MFSAIALIVPRKGADFELQKVELDMLQPQEILVKLIATGICHTDLAVQHGKIPMPFPVALGHEGDDLQIILCCHVLTSDRSWYSGCSRDRKI
jgi:Zn-dependent alcohol dehydrogenase